MFKSLVESGAAVHHKRQSCRACGEFKLHRFLTLGPTPLANSFLRSPSEFAAECSYPLDVYFCETCSLVQLLDVIDPEVLFRNYIYVTGTSETIAAHNEEYAQTLARLLDLNDKELVVEVASNDGSLLKHFQPYGVRTLGVEPASNIAELARANGIDTVNEFFNQEVARELRAIYGPARAVIGNNVLAHVDESRDFLGGCRELIDDRGLVVIEVPYLGDLLDRLEYDTIYHEHLCYFSVTTLLRLCESVGLSIVRMDRRSVHGGSLRMYARRSDKVGGHAIEVLPWAEQEREKGLTDLRRYQQFAQDVTNNRALIRDFLERLLREGKRVAGYGAPAKGNTLLNYCGIDTRYLAFTVDKSPLKVGLYTPGTHIPVRPVSTLIEEQPDYVLILAWNFADEIVRQQCAYRERGGQFITPVPEPRMV